ncbi:GRAM domain-containing protein [Alkalibacillus sp. S2W]|uniref:GRAM domain-containing protein n=1 Tax=Alkalibacillus sp. S2W TaxID=3386553 RepID=UPI00398D1E39
MSEAYEHKDGANLFKGIEAVGGKLYLTKEALIHRPHKFNIQSGETVIELKDIAEVLTRNTLLVIPNGLLVKTTGGNKYKLVVFDRDNWIEKINLFRQVWN